MKTLNLTTIIAVFLLLSMNGIQAQNKPASTGKSSAEAAITKSLDNFYAAYHVKDFTNVLAFITEDCLICGTDSKEFWDKAAHIKLFKTMAADTSVHLPLAKIDKRVIRLDKENKSAIVIEQSFINEWSTKIPVRNVSHLVNIKGKWYCDFMSSSFIPDNKDLDKIYKSVM